MSSSLPKFERFLKWAQDNAATPEVYEFLLTKHKAFVASLQRLLDSGEMVIEKGTRITVQVGTGDFDGHDEVSGKAFKSFCHIVTFALPIGEVGFMALLNEEGKFYHYQLLDEELLKRTPALSSLVH